MRNVLNKTAGKTRIVVTCPDTGVVVITKLTYEQMIMPRIRPMLFACVCGDVHKLLFVGGRRGWRGNSPTPRDRHRTG